MSTDDAPMRYEETFDRIKKMTQALPEINRNSLQYIMRHLNQLKNLKPIKGMIKLNCCVILVLPKRRRKRPMEWTLNRCRLCGAPQFSMKLWGAPTPKIRLSSPGSLALAYKT